MSLSNRSFYPEWSRTPPPIWDFPLNSLVPVISLKYNSLKIHIDLNDDTMSSSVTTKTLKRSTSSGELKCGSCSKSIAGDAHVENKEQGPLCNHCKEVAEEEPWSEDSENEEDSSSSSEEETDVSDDSEDEEDDDSDNATMDESN